MIMAVYLIAVPHIEDRITPLCFQFICNNFETLTTSSSYGITAWKENKRKVIHSIFTILTIMFETMGDLKPLKSLSSHPYSGMQFFGQIKSI